MEECEIRLLREVIGCTLHADCRLLDWNAESLREQLQRVYGGLFSAGQMQQFPLRQYLRQMQPRTVYGVQGRYLLYYVLMMTPGLPQQVLVIGPCLLEPPTDEFVRRVLLRNRLSLAGEAAFRRFYQQWPVADKAQLHTLGRSVGQYLYRGEAVDHRYFSAWDEPLVQPHYADDAARRLEMKTIEQAYARESALLDAVRAGRRAEAFDLFTSRPPDGRAQRYSADPLRNARDRAIALQAKLCRAAQEGGVHPVHLEQTAARLCRRIEQAGTLQEVHETAQDMLRSYIQLVQRTAAPGYSLLVQRAISLIHLDLSAPLQVSTIAGILEVKPENLSRTFRYQTGISLTEYIHKARIRQAVRYLDETDLSIRDIALYVGYDDINYFSRVFKKYVSRSPREYRRIVKGEQRAARPLEEQPPQPKAGHALE